MTRQLAPVAVFVTAALAVVVLRGELRLRDAEERLRTLREAHAAVDAVPRCARSAYGTDAAFHACRYERAVDRVAAAGASGLRFEFLGDAAVTALDAGRPDDARRWLREARAAIGAAGDDDDVGEAPEKAAVAEGRLALLDGDRATARDRLLASARALTEATQLSFGPNATLARDLLAAGDTATVRAYLAALDTTWTDGADKVAAWRAALDQGEGPDFGANLVY